MRFKRSLALERGMDLTPVVDVVFNLLIFFMLTSPFVAQAGVPLKLPETHRPSAIMPGKVEVFILETDSILFEGRETTPEDLATALKGRLADDGTVTIHSDKKASIGVVLQVRDACIEAGVLQINLRTLEKKTPN
ncbi:MAG: biopolymer transporter ExbD [Planctomycetota bacterium]|nr:biopolymer transporter ExbD [Planctomycetota bacterium]